LQPFSSLSRESASTASLNSKSSMIGKRVIDDAPQGHWKTTTFVAALRTMA
jgi:hypothetical protein